MNPFTTQRLSVRDWQPALANPAARERLEAALPAMLSERVLRHLPDPLQLSAQSGGISSWIDARAAESDVLLVEQKPHNTLIGLLILARTPGVDHTPDLHIGYMLGEAVWGQGMASELIAGLVAALQDLGPVRLLGGVSKDNPASARVLEKAGFALSPEDTTPDTEMYVLRVR